MNPQWGAGGRGDLAEAMLPVAARLSVITRGEGGPEDTRDILSSLTPEQTTALVIVLAGLTDPDAPLGAVLGWLDFDEYGRPTVPDWDDRTTLRDIAEDDYRPPESSLDETAVDAYLKGRPVKVTVAERIEAIARGLGDGLGFADFDKLHGLSDGATVRFVTRARKRAEKRGEDFPELVSSLTPTVFSAEQVLDIRNRSAAGSTDLEISLAYEVSPETIRCIVVGKTHTEVGGPLRAKRAKKAAAPAASQRGFMGNRALADAS